MKKVLISERHPSFIYHSNEVVTHFHFYTENLRIEDVVFNDLQLCHLGYFTITSEFALWRYQGQ